MGMEGKRKITLKQVAAELNISASTVRLALMGDLKVRETTRSLVTQTAARMGYIFKVPAVSYIKNSGARVTIYDIAASLLLSPATVSRALAGNQRINKNTIELVTDRAKRMGYIPGHSAKNLRSNPHVVPGEQCEKQATIHDIAIATGLSTSTISRCLNDDHQVSKATKTKILAAANTLGFIGNSAARELKIKATKTIGVLIPGFGDPSINAVLSGIQKVAGTAGYQLIVCNAFQQAAGPDAPSSFPLGNCTDGLIILTTGSLTRTGLQFYKRVKPIIDLAGNVNDAGFSIDHYEAIYLLTKHLILNGHKNILLLNTDDGSYPRHRLAGYRAALDEHELSFDHQNILNYTQADLSYTELTRFVSACAGRIDAVIGVEYDLCEQLYENTPSTIHIAGLDTGFHLTTRDLLITTITFDRQELGTSIAQRLLNKLNTRLPVKNDHQPVNLKLVILPRQEDQGILILA